MNSKEFTQVVVSKVYLKVADIDGHSLLLTWPQIRSTRNHQKSQLFELFADSLRG